MSDAPLFEMVSVEGSYHDEDWEYGICYVDQFTGRQSFEQNYAGDPRSFELAQTRLHSMAQGKPNWAESMVARRRRTEWEPMPETRVGSGSDQ
jgi:hypothetical protein